MLGDELSALREMLQNTVKFHSSLKIVDIGRSWRPEKETGRRCQRDLENHWHGIRGDDGVATFRLQQWKTVLDDKGLADLVAGDRRKPKALRPRRMH